MKKIILILTAILFTTYSFSQNNCPFSWPQLGIEDHVTLASTPNNNEYCVKIYVHAATNISTVQDVQDAINQLRSDFDNSNTNITFDWDETINWFNHERFDNPDNYSTIFSTPQLSHTDGVDIILLGGSSPKNEGFTNPSPNSGIQFYVSGTTVDGPILERYKTNDISHEMGHALSLLHLKGSCNENPNESNCASTGDYICDTPADPGVFEENILFDLNGNCIGWNGYSCSNLQYDINTYNPDLTNIMSQGLSACKTSFSSQQGQRMRNAIATFSCLQEVLSDNCNIDEESCDHCPIVPIYNLENIINCKWKFSADPNTNCPDENYTYFWYVDDELVSNEQTFIYDFENDGEYLVYGRIEYENECKADFKKKFTCKEGRIKLSPNPTKPNSQLVFEGVNSKNVSSIELFDLFGNSKMKIKPSSKLFTIPQLQSGIYIVKFYTTYGIKQKKLIIE